MCLRLSTIWLALVSTSQTESLIVSSVTYAGIGAPFRFSSEDLCVTSGRASRENRTERSLGVKILPPFTLPQPFGRHLEASFLRRVPNRVWLSPAEHINFPSQGNRPDRD